MTTRSRPPLAGFRWLKQAINLGHGNPKAVFGGAALLVVLALLPSLVTVPLQLGTTPGPWTLVAVMVISMLGGLLLVPLFAGYLRIVDAAERGLPARALDLFAPYRNGEAPRLLGFGVAMLLVYVLMFAVIVALAGTAVAQWYLQAMGAGGAAGQASLAQGLPEGFGIAVAVGSVLGLLMVGFYSISLGQVALGGRGVLEALRDGASGALKNLLPLLVFALTLLVGWIVLALGLGLVAMLLAFVGKLVGGQWLALVLFVPIYIALLLAIFVVMFGVMYHLWRDVCGDDRTPAPAGEALAA